MEGKTDLPSRRINGEKPDSVNLSRSFQTTKSSSSDTSRAELIQSFQAACKRRRPVGMVQPRRNVIPQQEISKDSSVQPNSRVVGTKSKEDIPKDNILRRFVSTSGNTVSVGAESQDIASTAPPSEWGSTVNTHEKFMLRSDQKDHDGIESDKPLPQVAKKVQFSSENNASSQGAGDPLTARIDDILSHLDSLALTEMEWDRSNQMDTSANNQNWQHHCDQSMEMDNCFRSESGISSLLDRKTAAAQDKLHHLENFLQNDLNNAMTQSSVAGLSGITSTIINSASAPMIRSTPYCLQPQSRGSRSETEPAGSGDTIKNVVAQDQVNQLENFLRNDMNNAMTQSSVVGSSCVTSTLLNSTSAPMISSTTYQRQTRDTLPEKERAREAEARVDVLQPLDSSLKYVDGILFSRSAVTSQAISSTSDVNLSSAPSKEQQSLLPRDPRIDRYSSVGNDISDKGNAIDIKSQNEVSQAALVDESVDKSKSEKIEKGASGKSATASRKKGYDPDLFFKVNGKLYQRLGKIGSGGSSEVHKVISSDCKIFALKKIKLRGRDYATAYGFCQEIEYLNRLKGKNNIIQLIDYEVTDKTLLQEVMKGSMNNKDGRVKDDGHIYMVLEYGEIDLAHMLSQKWKELEGSNATIDENWLRFYWQQILLAVNTIHEERIVHSDLKPANFLLVRGSLKLIDFGIAKAIMSDTTNIQRDSQVGTLSYMSPEAFMCNDTDANGNTIKCGRPSDIWSLGCILYQMVYGRTPFSEYKTFWAKFKVITDPNHEISYEPLPNPWLLDLMKKCLAWDRNQRWRIPQLLQHPFLVPPVVVPQTRSLLQPNSNVRNISLFETIEESNEGNERVSMLCSQLHGMVRVDASVSVREQQRELLFKISSLCSQLQEELAKA